LEKNPVLLEKNPVKMEKNSVSIRFEGGRRVRRRVP
jgi:hypothetical protein